MTYRIGIIGTGFGAKVHAPVFQAHPDFEVQALSSVFRNNADSVAAELGVPKAYSDWRTMIREEDLDAVVIASNPSEHMLMSLEALSNGLHVLCEKPPALNTDESRAMLQAAVQSDKVAAMNFEWRFLPERQKIKEIVKQGTLGDLLHVHWRDTFAAWPAFRDRANSWLWQTKHAGGFFGAIGSHMVDSLMYWFGTFHWVQGATETHVYARSNGAQLQAADADDSFSFQGQFSSGGTCSVQLTLAAVGLPPSIEIYGTTGTLVFDGTHLKIATKDNRTYQAVDLAPKIDASGFQEGIRNYVHPQWKLIDAFSQSLSGTSAPDLPSFYDAANVQSVMDAVRTSNRTGKQMVELIRRPL